MERKFTIVHVVGRNDVIFLSNICVFCLILIEFFFILESLKDTDYFEFSKLFTNLEDVQKLTYKVLDLQSTNAQESINREDRDYQGAAYNIFNEWRKRQPNGKVAFKTLLDSLKKHDWSQMATDLKNIVESGEGK